MQKISIKKIFSGLWLFFLIAAGSVYSAEATQDIRGLFDSRVRYIIYFSNGEDAVSVIRDVEIRGFTEIAGKTFLLIKSYGFNLKDVDGFILFDAVMAILPDREFKVETEKRIYAK